VNRVVPDWALLEQAERLAAGLAEGPTRAYGGVKRLVQTGLTDSLESQMERETRFIAEMSATPDGREGVRAFVERRSPDFRTAR